MMYVYNTVYIHTYLACSFLLLQLVQSSSIQRLLHNAISMYETYTIISMHTCKQS